MSTAILSPTTRKGKRSPLVTGGNLSFRTVLMPEARVMRAYAMFAANPRFADVNAIASPVSPGNGYVTFRPANPERCDALLSLFEQGRDQRAEDGVFGPLPFEWEPTGEGDGSEFCFSPKVNRRTGEITYEPYVVSPRECECADWHYRCRRLGIQCKHQRAQKIRRERGL